MMAGLAIHIEKSEYFENNLIWHKIYYIAWPLHQYKYNEFEHIGFVQPGTHGMFTYCTTKKQIQNVCLSECICSYLHQSILKYVKPSLSFTDGFWFFFRSRPDEYVVHCLLSCSYHALKLLSFKHYCVVNELLFLHIYMLLTDLCYLSKIISNNLPRYFHTIL